MCSSVVLECLPTEHAETWALVVLLFHKFRHEEVEVRGSTSGVSLKFEARLGYMRPV